LLYKAFSPTPEDWRVHGTETIEVVSIFMNEIHHFTVFKKEGDELVPISLRSGKKLNARLDHDYAPIKVIADVPKGKPMFVIITTMWEGERMNPPPPHFQRHYYEVHIHSEQDLLGGEWVEGGKFRRSGKVQKVE
jgi:hypothetical protein